MPPWDSLSDDEKRLFARMAEVFAGFSEYTDHQIGRVIDYLEESGQLDNTIVLYCADNGASGEGSPHGSVNENKFFNNWPDDMEENLKHLDDLGSPNTYNHYPTGWAAAFSTPFKMFKRYSYAGGTCDPLVIHWPKGIAARGEIRHQYHHVTDIVPTILDCCGVEFPDVFDGYEQVPLVGTSMRYSFDSADAPTTKERQYYAMLGTRGMWEKGWKAVAVHGPTSGIGNFDQDEWELYHLEEDRAEAHDLAAEHPDKLKALIDLWMEEAEKYDVLPLDDRLPVEILMDPRPQGEPPRETYVYYPGTAEVPEAAAVNIRGRSYRILAEVEIDDARGRGRDLRPRLALRRARAVPQGPAPALRLQLPRHRAEQDFASEPLEPGRYVLGMEFKKESRGEHGELHGTTSLYVDDDVVAEGPMRAQPAYFALCGDGLCVGRDSSDAGEQPVPARRGRSRAARSSRSRSTSATTSTSTSSGRRWRRSRASDVRVTPRLSLGVAARRRDRRPDGLGGARARSRWRTRRSPASRPVVGLYAAPPALLLYALLGSSTPPDRRADVGHRGAVGGGGGRRRDPAAADAFVALTAALAMATGIVGARSPACCASASWPTSSPSRCSRASSSASR